MVFCGLCLEILFVAILFSRERRKKRSYTGSFCSRNFFYIPDFKYVTCGSVLKLKNPRQNIRLHSHDVKYGSGSGQQVKIFSFILKNLFASYLSFPHLP